MMNEANWDIFIMRPWVPKKWLIMLVKLVSRNLSTFLNSRENDQITSFKFHPLNLGVWQFYAPIKNLITKSPLSLKETNFINKNLKNRVLRNMSNKDVVITTRDIFPEFSATPKKILLAEMRELYPSRIWRREVPVSDYPINLDEEKAKTNAYIENFEYIRLNASGLITYSDIARESFIANGYSPSKIFVFPLRYPNISVVRFSRKQTTKCLFVGRDDPNKGLDLAVLATLEAGVTLTVVGHYSNEVINWMKSFTHVEYVGSVNRSYVRKLMSSSHALLAPSVESYGLTVVEALESGCLVVSSKMNGAASTFYKNSNVFCSETLDLLNITRNLHFALASNFNFDEQVSVENFSDKFIKFVQEL